MFLEIFVKTNQWRSELESPSPDRWGFFKLRLIICAAEGPGDCFLGIIFRWLWLTLEHDGHQVRFRWGDYICSPSGSHYKYSTGVIMLGTSSLVRKSCEIPPSCVRYWSCRWLGIITSHPCSRAVVPNIFLENIYDDIRALLSSGSQMWVRVLLGVLEAPLVGLGHFNS